MLWVIGPGTRGWHGVVGGVVVVVDGRWIGWVVSMVPVIVRGAQRDRHVLYGGSGSGLKKRRTYCAGGLS